MEQFAQLDKIEKSNDIICLRMFYNKVETTICNLKSLNIELSAYGSLLISVLTSKSPPIFKHYSHKNFLIEFFFYLHIYTFKQKYAITRYVNINVPGIQVKKA